VSGISRVNGLPYGLCILNDCKYSYDVNIREIGLTVLRSPIYAHHMPVIPDPEREYSFMDQGRQQFRYMLLPHLDSWETADDDQRAAELNQPPICFFETYHPDGKLPTSASFLSISQANVIATVLKQSEDNSDLIVRCIETHQEAALATICLPFWQRVFEAQFSPCEIKTFRIPKDSSLPVSETNLLEWRDECASI
jgi:alpha-mannosidase